MSDTPADTSNNEAASTSSTPIYKSKFFMLVLFVVFCLIGLSILAVQYKNGRSSGLASDSKSEDKPKEKSKDESKDKSGETKSSLIQKDSPRAKTSFLSGKERTRGSHLINNPINI